RGGRLLRLGELHRSGTPDRRRRARDAAASLLGGIWRRPRAAFRGHRARRRRARPPGPPLRAERGRAVVLHRGVRHRSTHRAAPHQRRGARRARAHPPGRDDRRLPPRASRGKRRARRRRGGHMSWRRLWTLMRREVLATLRDPFTVTILITVPIAA